MTQRERVLSLLRTYSTGVTTGEFLRQRIPRFSARIQELRDKGYVITTERVREGQYRFKLVSEPGSGPSVSSVTSAVTCPVCNRRFAGTIALHDHITQEGHTRSDTLFDSPAVTSARSAITGERL